MTTSDYAEDISFPNAAAAHERMVASLDIDERAPAGRQEASS